MTFVEELPSSTWKVSILDNKGNSKVTRYKDFSNMPQNAKEAIAILKTAEPSVSIPNIGMKLDSGYVLYGYP